MLYDLYGHSVRAKVQIGIRPGLRLPLEGEKQKSESFGFEPLLEG
jgi:hypothetical protein